MYTGINPNTFKLKIKQISGMIKLKCLALSYAYNTILFSFGGF